MEIHWEQAMKDFQHNQKEDIAECKRIIEEIETSNFSMLDARDVNYYANELNKYSNRKDKNGQPNPYTPNEIRRMNMDAQDLDGFDMFDTFMDDDTDSIIDFY